MGIHMEENVGTCGLRADGQFTMQAPGEYYETLHTIAINTRETEFGSIVEPIPITIKTYKPFMNGRTVSLPYSVPPQQMISTFAAAPRVPMSLDLKPSTSSYAPGTSCSPVKEEAKGDKVARPPKKKWIKEYLEEPKSPVPVSLVCTNIPANGLVVRAPSPPVPLPVCLPLDAVSAPTAILDFTQEHSRPRTTSHGPLQIPSPPSVGSNGSSTSTVSSGSAPRAGTREVHNKLEKNRRAHLKECFELLKRQLPATPDDKKTSNLSILGSAIRYIQVLRRKERECEHEMERLAREKIAAQQRLAALKREVTVRATVTPRNIECGDDKDERVNGQVLGIPISMTSSPPPSLPLSPRSLNLSTKLRTLPVHIAPTTSQVVRTSYGARHNTLTLTTLTATEPTSSTHQNGVSDVNSLSTTLMHPAQLHLPLSQVVGGGGLVVGGALQLVSTPGALRVLHAPNINGVTTSDNNRIPSRDNGLITPPPHTEMSGSVGGVSSMSVGPNMVVSGLTPLVVSQPNYLHSHTLTHKMVETQVVKGNVTPLTVSAQYLSATTLMKPVVMVSSGNTPPSSSA